jgi:hypothetical protein
MHSGAHTFSPGFKFSKLDAIILFVGLFIAADLAAVMPWLGISIGFVIAHFFLFCNVVRMTRSSELAWAGLFVVLAASTTLTGQPHWAWTLAIAFVGAVFLVFLEMRKPSYHGIFWQRINPNLPQWWETHSERLHGRGCYESAR